MQWTRLEDSSVLPLTIAVGRGFTGIVQLLIDGGIREVEGGMALPNALYVAIRFRQINILRMLLKVDGEEGRSELANTSFKDGHLLHVGAAFGNLAAVGILLEAGADEA
ncbi:unnamed protein product, partial [Laminaria digitata]